jgi:hypothetical protein
MNFSNLNRVDGFYEWNDDVCTHHIWQLAIGEQQDMNTTNFSETGGWPGCVWQSSVSTSSQEQAGTKTKRRQHQASSIKLTER